MKIEKLFKLIRILQRNIKRFNRHLRKLKSTKQC